MTLSVCLITRDEQFNMPRVLRSVAGLADQVIVADTGSTDRTVMAAREKGATVFPFAWDDDFAAARNFALDQATGDWIFWLNPDEELVPESAPLVRAAMNEADVLAYLIVVRELRRPDRPDYFTETVQYRLFRRHSELRYVGRVHPQFRTPVEAVAHQEEKQVRRSPIVVRHFAYLSVLSEPKLRWAARLLARELQDRPDNFAAGVDYGKTLLLLNDPTGHDLLAQAVEKLLPFCHAPAPPFGEVHVLLEYLLTVTPEQSRAQLTRDEAWDLAERWFPTSPPLLWVRAAQYFRQDHFQQAAALLETLVRLGQTGTYDRTHPFDPAIIGADALMNLGTCHLRLRDFDRAEACFRQLASTQTHGAQAARNLSLVEGLRRQGGG